MELETDATTEADGIASGINLRAGWREDMVFSITPTDRHPQIHAVLAPERGALPAGSDTYSSLLDQSSGDLLQDLVRPESKAIAASGD